MEIKVGFEIVHATTQATPMVIMLSIHPSRRADIIGKEVIVAEPDVPIGFYNDSFGNICGRLVAPAGGVTLRGSALVRDSGLPDVIVPTAQQLPIEQLPDDVYEQGAGVCRDFAHLALTFCRCMGIPARYCTGYMGDIGIPYDPAPMDFSGWFEVYLSGQWYTFDARHNKPRIGRILMGTGRDAADVALTTSFGRMDLAKFLVISDEVVAA